ncbi:MAG: helix-turn-helix domain-containing protein [Candidatus Bilamarchaeaceae archaeon]
MKSNFGRKAGRPKKLSPGTAERLRKIYFGEPYSLRELADMFGVSRMTVWRTVSC